MSAPTHTHMKVAKCVLKYLKESMGYGRMLMKPTKLNLIGYIDVDWANYHDNRRSGYCMFVDGNLVSWASSKKNIVSRCST